MINVCQKCLRLNPLGSFQCHYCDGQCQEIASKDLSAWRISQQQKNIKEAEDERTARKN